MVPSWMRQGCPWPNRAVFLADAQSPPMVQLAQPPPHHRAAAARFAALRLEEALPKMLAATAPGDRERVRANFYRVAAQPLGMYALIDYVNFKGEGVSPTERYNGKGWGLLQVLLTMSPSGDRWIPSPGRRTRC